MTDPADILARKVADHMFSQEGTGSAWGIVIDEVRIGYARLRMAVRGDMTNGHGTVHGGMIFSLADTAFAYACNSRNQTAVAASASVIFLAPAHEGDILIAEACEEALSGRSGAYGVTVRTPDGRSIAQFQGQSRIIGGPVITPDNQENEDG